MTDNQEINNQDDIHFNELFDSDIEATSFIMNNPFFNDDSYINYDVSIKEEDSGGYRANLSVKKRF